MDMEEAERKWRSHGILCVLTGVSVLVETDQAETYELAFP